MVEELERDSDTIEEKEIVALARVKNSLDLEDLRKSVIENSHYLPRSVAEKFNVVILDAPYRSFRFRIGILRELNIEDRRLLSRILEVYSQSAIKFVILDAMMFDVLLREAYEQRNLTRATTKKNQQQTRSNRVWGGGTQDQQTGTTVRIEGDDVAIEKLAGQRLDISNLDTYYEISALMESGDFDENELKTFDYVQFLLQDFILSGGSDLHLHSSRSGGRIRYRFQGTPYTRFSGIPLNRFQQILNSLCTLAAKDPGRMNRDIVESVIKLRIALEGEIRDVEFRFESLPTLHCPSVNLRGQVKPLRDITKVGFTPAQLADIDEAVSKDRGIVVVTGPTGSGKTNTLNCIFAILEKSEEDDDDKVILELGNPIEIESERRVQITIQETASEKLTDIIYQKMFKGCMRFDPDVIAFTEIRNADEAKIAFRAANTGHLVFTTMHAADVEETFGRLFEMGIDRSIISKGILAIVAQTLIQKLCRYCKIEDAEASAMSGKTIFRHNENGCTYCDDGKQKGFDGQTVVAEVLYFNKDIQQLIVEGCKPAEIISKAVERGYMIPMKRIALGKLNEGITSESEITQLVELRTDINADIEAMPGFVEDEDLFPLTVTEAEYIDVEV